MKEELTLLFTGDFYGGGRIESLIINEKYEDIFNDFIAFIRQADLSIANLESPLTLCETPIKKTGPSIKSDPATIRALNYAGFSLVTLANNHMMDFGKKGLEDTLKICRDHHIDTVGAGFNFKEASKTNYKNLNNRVFALINLAENEWSTTENDLPGTHPLNPIANYKIIKEAREKAEFVFVIVHGGHEMYSLPSIRMKATYQFFIDAGADAVIGHHTHCISGFEIYKNKPIFYSLGNFIFDKPSEKDQNWFKGLAVQFKINHKNITFNIIPLIQHRQKPGVYLANDMEKAEMFKNIEKLNAIIQDIDLLKREFDKYCRKVEKLYNYYLEPHTSRYLYALQSRKLLPKFLAKKKKMLYTNLFRCESHRDVMIKILQKK